MKQINDVVGYENLKIVQDSDSFKFSLESILLPDFVQIKPSVKKILDLCTGNAPIPIILSLKTSASIVGVEIQKDVFDMATETVEINDKCEQITIINDDINNLSKYYKKEYFDIITCNPPYFKYDKNSFINKSDYKTIARHEVSICLKQVIKVASDYLKYGGHFYLVHRSERIEEIINELSRCNFAVKKIRFIFAKSGKSSELLLIDAVKGGKKGAIIMFPLTIYKNDNTYTEDVQNIINGVLK